MKNVSLYLIAVLTLFATASCKQEGFKRTKSGLIYKLFSDKKGPVAKSGQFLKLQVVSKIHDSVLSTSVGSIPGYARVDSSRNDYSPNEIFSLLREGDSIIVVESADTLRRKYGQLPPFIKKGDKLVISFKVLKLFPTQDLVMTDRNMELDHQKAREIKQVEDYLTANKINASKTDLGTYYVVTTPGDGPQVDSNKQVSVRYTGKMIPTGKVFESNMNPPGNEPIKFVIGRHEVIEGWDDGLKKFKKGGKGTLYIPAYLAYNQQARPGTTPFENLQFDIEIVDVTDAPAASAAPSMSMPGGMPGSRMPMQGMRPNRPMPQGAPPQQQPQH